MYYGQFETDRYIQSYFEPSFRGTCIEVGATDGILGSNTYYFERQGWTSLCVEPNYNYFVQLQRNRKHSCNYACGKEHLIHQKFEVFDLGNNQSAISSLTVDERLVESHAHLIKNKFTQLV